MMKKELECGTVVPGCEQKIHAETEGELLVKLGDHMRAAHGIERISDSLKAKALAAVRETGAA